jgi:hypothetical protein
MDQTHKINELVKVLAKDSALAYYVRSNKSDQSDQSDQSVEQDNVILINIHAPHSKKKFIEVMTAYCEFVDSIEQTVILSGDFNAILVLNDKTLSCYHNDSDEMELIFEHTFSKRTSMTNATISTTHKIRIITTQINKVGKINSAEIDYVLVNNCVDTDIVETCVLGSNGEIHQNMFQSVNSCSDHFAVLAYVNNIGNIMTFNMCGESLNNGIKRNIFEFMPEELYLMYQSKWSEIKNRIDEIIAEKLDKNVHYSSFLRPVKELPFLELFNTHMLPDCLHDRLINNEFFKDQFSVYDTLIFEFEEYPDKNIAEKGTTILEFWFSLYSDPLLSKFFIDWFNIVAQSNPENSIDRIYNNMNNVNIFCLQEVTEGEVRTLCELMPNYGFTVHVGDFHQKMDKKTGLNELDKNGNPIMFKTRGVIITKNK